MATKAPAAKKTAQKKEARKDLSKTYNEFKTFEGQQYTGMKVGRSHKWNYDAGVWKETKVTPDLWEINFAVTKRRAGKAPEGSGVPVGTEYHWYILAHQHVRKLDANSYTTALTGLKYKLAHRRADKDKWSASARAQRNRLIKVLEDLIAQLQKEPPEESMQPEQPEVKKEKAPAKKSAGKVKAPAIAKTKPSDGVMQRKTTRKRTTATKSKQPELVM
jgi:hypothetical protein